MRRLTLAGKIISDNNPCYVVAEIGQNHNGSVDNATALIRSAAKAGADAVKLQKRHNATLYTGEMLSKPYVHEHSFGATYGAHRAALEFDQDEYLACQAQAAQSHVHLLATAFDEKSVEFLMSLNVPAIKIASAGVTDSALLAYASACRVPLILSTGGGTLKDIDRAVNTVTSFHSELAILHCTATYPVRNPVELNLRCIQSLRDAYPDFVIGWSGHDSGFEMSLIAYALGARIIEKHFTLDRSMRGADHLFSLEPHELEQLCTELRRGHEALGNGVKAYYPSELPAIAKMRRRTTSTGLKITGEFDASSH